MRYLINESTYICCAFPTGHSATITIYKLSDNSAVVSAQPMSEIPGSGMFKYLASLAPVVATEYLWVATDGYDSRAGKIVLGGYPDQIKDQTDALHFTGDDVKATLDSETVAVADKTGFFLAVTPPTKEEISTKVWGETARALTDKSGFSGSGTVTDKTGFSLATSPPTKEEIDTELSANHGAGLWGGAAGSGATLKTYTQLYGGLPLADCEIWVSTDLLQTNIVASGVTDALGKVYLYPDVPVGTPLYIWKRKTGYTFTNPDMETM